MTTRATLEVEAGTDLRGMIQMATTKDYRVIANAVARTLDNAPTGGTYRERTAWANGIQELVTRLADDLKAQNSAFRYDTFFEAAGLDKWGNTPDQAALDECTREAS